MRKLDIYLILLVTPLYLAQALSQTELIGPPLGLEYGMTYTEVKTKLKERDIKLEKMKEEEKYKLPEGFKVAKAGKYKVLDKKTDMNFACFNADGELCAFQINLRWFKEKGKALAFYEKDLKPAIYAKYSGEGFVEHKDPDHEGNVPVFAFRDEVGNELGVFFQDQTTLLGDAFWIVLYYNNEEILREIRKEQKATEEF